MVVRRRRGRKELDVRSLGRDGRATGPAVDAGGAHGGEEHAVEAGVTAADGAITRLVVELLDRSHGSMMPPSTPRDERESDMKGIALRLVDEVFVSGLDHVREVVELIEPIELRVALD